MNSESGRILIVNDNQENLCILDSLLSANGYEVYSAGIGEIDESFFSGDIPDCIILDVSIPENGMFNICDMINDQPAFADIPVIFACDEWDHDGVITVFKAGAADYIIKPYRREEVLARVRNHVALVRMKRRLDERVHERTVELAGANELLSNTVDEYRRILKDLQDNETLLLTIALNIPNSYLAIIEKDYTIGFASGREFKKIGIDPWRLIGLPIEKVFRDKADVVREHFSLAFEGSESSFELFFNNQYLYYRTVPLTDSEGVVKRILTVAENITERKESELHIKESLHEKETLLREIHHRVKNNMQLVSSLLTLQAGYSGSSDLEDIFRTLQRRIYSMSLVHEKLYHYKQFSKINFREYIKELIAEIQKAFSAEDICGQVIFNLNLDNEYLSIERAIPCGLILNELVMNSFKHAFIGKNSPLITVEFLKNEDDGFTLSVSDNGSGLPDDFDIMTSDSMGMVLLRELTGQIHGSIMVNSRGGTEFRIVFGPERKEPVHHHVGEAGNGSRKIMIVEDERIISTMLRKIIEEQGYTVSGCVASGKDAIHHALNSRPDLVIMDIVLEDEIDGVEAARIITGETGIPVIFLTGNSDTATLKAARETGPYDMLTKPVRKNQLMNVIRGALG